MRFRPPAKKSALSWQTVAALYHPAADRDNQTTGAFQGLSDVLIRLMIPPQVCRGVASVAELGLFDQITFGADIFRK